MKKIFIMVAAIIFMANVACAKVQVDYGVSEVYSHEDIDAAIKVLESNYNDPIHSLKSLKYAGNDCPVKENIDSVQYMKLSAVVYVSPDNFCTTFSQGYYTTDILWLVRTYGGNWDFVESNVIYSDKTIDSLEINYAESEIYSRAEMYDAIDIIKSKFNEWRGCKLHAIRYAGDSANSAENIKWLNELAPGENFAQCIEFLSDFYVSAEAADFTTFNPNSEYKNWQWWLARTDGGDWKLLTFGY